MIGGILLIQRVRWLENVSSGNRFSHERRSRVVEHYLDIVLCDVLIEFAIGTR
jgi:hypothetical protein